MRHHTKTLTCRTCTNIKHSHDNKVRQRKLSHRGNATYCTLKLLFGVHFLTLTHSTHFILKNSIVSLISSDFCEKLKIQHNYSLIRVLIQIRNVRQDLSESHCFPPPVLMQMRRSTTFPLPLEIRIPTSRAVRRIASGHRRGGSQPSGREL